MASTTKEFDWYDGGAGDLFALQAFNLFFGGEELDIAGSFGAESKII